MTFSPGDAVRVASRSHDGHHRTPSYLKGKLGIVVRAHDSFPNPETRAYAGDGLPERRLYLVGFEQQAVWAGYDGPSGDRLLADVFEHWLETPA